MGLHDHRAAGGQGRGGITTGHGEGEGKIGRTENRHRAERPEHRTHIRLGHRLALGIGVIDARIHPASFLGHRGEQAQLAGGAADFPLQARFRQAGFQIAALDEGGGVFLDQVGNAAQQGRAGFAITEA